MSLIPILVALVILGLVLWVIDQITMDATVKKIIHVVVIVFVCLYLLQVLGLLGSVDLRIH